MWTRYAILVASVWAGGVSAAAADSSCEPIARAMMLVSEQPGVRQRTYDGNPPKILTEAVSVRDAMYVRGDAEGPWRKVAVDQATRRRLAEQGLKTLPLSECSGGETVTLDGAATRLYRYRTPDPLRPGSFSAGELWVGRSDGLPKRVGLGTDGYQIIEYGEFAAPSDVIEPRQRRPTR